MAAWRRRIAIYFFLAYVLISVAIPTLGLYAAHQQDEPIPFSWQMFSRLPGDAPRD